MAKAQKPKDIDSYISQFPAGVQAILEKVRATIRHNAPEAKETIKLGGKGPAFLFGDDLGTVSKVDWPKKPGSGGGT